MKPRFSPQKLLIISLLFSSASLTATAASRIYEARRCEAIRADTERREVEIAKLEVESARLKESIKRTEQRIKALQDKLRR